MTEGLNIKGILKLNNGLEENPMVAVSDLQNIKNGLEGLVKEGEGIMHNPSIEDIYKYTLATQISINKYLEEFNYLLEISRKNKDNLTTSLLHSIKNMIGASYSFSSDILEDLSILDKEKKLSDEEIKMYHKNIKQNIENSSKMVDELTKHLELNAGEFEVKITSIPLKEESDNIINQCKSVDMTKKVEIVNNIDPKIEIQADKIILRESITNLCANALKFTPDDGRIDLNYREDGEYVYIDVVDTGVGISEENQKKILDINGEKYTTKGLKDEKGSGVGIKLMIEMLKFVNGKIKIKSAPGEGSTFTIKLHKN
jgi:signal transduction histidine kinase